jgi:hypothetical protein
MLWAVAVLARCSCKRSGHPVFIITVPRTWGMLMKLDLGCSR